MSGMRRRKTRIIEIDVCSHFHPRSRCAMIHSHVLFFLPVGASIILISDFDVEYSQTYNFDVKASNPDGLKVETQEYTVVVNDGTLCFVIVEIPSDGTEKKKQGDLKQDEAFLQLNATSSDGCDEDEFIFVSNSQMYRGFEDTNFVDVTTFDLSPEGNLSPVVVTVDTGEYQLKVVAVNESDPTDQLSISESLLTIVVVDDQNSAPYFDEEYSRNIRLPKEEDEFLFQLRALDPDDKSSGNNQLIFEELSESNSRTETTYFTVEADGKVIAFSNLFTNDIVDLTVQVTDSGIPPLSDNTTIQIKLTMDAAPILETLCGEVVFIMENVTRGTPVCNVVSKGEEDVSFSLTSGNEAFVIDENGAIKTNDTLDYEETQDYQVVVNAEGLDTKLNSTTQILVKITDINEHPPVLSENYFFILLEDSGDLSCESDFGFIIATDEDGSEENSFTSYSLEGDKRFVIDETEGVISKTECIDVDEPSENSSVILILRAENSKADPMLDDTAVVNITIKDINDKSPVLILEGPQDIVREEFIPEEELFVFSYSDNDTSASNRDSVYHFEPSEKDAQDYFEFDEKEGKISTTTTPPPPGTDIAILVTIMNTAEPMLSSSMTVFYSNREGSYFPEELLTQSVNVEENDVGTVETDIPGPVGSLSTTQYSVFYTDGTCAEDIKVEYKSDTFLKLSTTALDFEVPDNRVFNITIAFASDEDNCAAVKRKKRQANVFATTDSSLVTINLVNVNDEPPSFTDFPLGTGSRNFYQAIHVSRVVGETVYDLSQEGGKVEDLDGMPTTLTYAETGMNNLVNVLSDGSVVLEKFLSNDDADGVTHDVEVEVVDSEQGGSDAATLRLRVMADADIFMLWFKWLNDSQDQDLLQCVEECFPVDIHVFSERVVKSEGQNSALWLYAVNGQDNEDFMTRQEFVQTWDENKCSETCKTGGLFKESVGWTSIQIAVFTLAVLIFVGAVIFILILFYSYSM
ncbi:Cadherin EGF LAG seven-pass G-type receptor 3 [Holothuria leucospilota]|uniref:Cadherin EGF LAG seven-pass G-type receptor 3 n=1 Tax=Holothuria leucospilota TaxID=206669 RepID=A0A9Q1BF65_HOLLE|nr:Cadherin EGF LAG seven-pass G-type receptor 3 [Holothuria leucospilota]